ncbi:MAG: CHASE3 domain-containing protein, partial [Cellulophaga sp.]
MVKSYKIFIILLIIAIALLAFLGSNSYKQIREQEKTAELVVYTLRVESEINTLFSEYALMQSQVLKNKLFNKVNHTILLKKYKDSARETFSKLSFLIKDKPEQQKRLNELATIQFKFYEAIDEFNAYKTDTKKEKVNDSALLQNVSVLMAKIEGIKKNMLSHEELYLQEQRDQLTTSRRLNPITTLFLGMSAI